MTNCYVHFTILRRDTAVSKTGNIHHVVYILVREMNNKKKGTVKVQVMMIIMRRTQVNGAE